MQNSVLIIDDDRDVCNVLMNILTGEGYQTYSVCSGTEGLEKIKKKKYDLIILDLKLPDISGTEVLRQIRNFDKDVSVIILTGYPEVDTAIAAFKNHAVDYIKKPFKVSNLRAVIQKELRKKSIKQDPGITEIKNVGIKIKSLRKKNEMSLGTLAEKTRLSKSFLSELERKKKFPRLSTLQTIAQELGVNVNLFFK